MTSVAGPSRAGPSSRQNGSSLVRQNTAVKHDVGRGPPTKHESAIVVDSDSDPEVIVIGGDSDSDIEFVGMRSKTTRDAPTDAPIPLKPQIAQDDYSDDELVPDGFELWEPTKPVKFAVKAVEPKYEVVDDKEPELAWNPPTMSWMHEECTGARSAGAFIEPVQSAGDAVDTTWQRYQLIPDLTRVSSSSYSRPLSVRMRSRYGPPDRETMAYLETSYLYSRPVVRIPGMNAPRGAVNYIAQSKGYVAVGRTYEEAAAYDGGGLVLWRVKDQKAQDIPAHVTQSARGSGRRNDPDELDSERKQHSIATLAFDPADNLSLVSAGHDNTVQQWAICEENDTVEHVGSEPVRKPGYLEFHPDGNIAAVGCADGLLLFDTSESLQRCYHWKWKRQGQEVVSASWGRGRSHNTIVAGTQHQDLVIGKLALLDPEVTRLVSCTDSESCSTLAIDPTGTITAFTGSGRGGNPRRHILRLYDVKRTGWQGTSQIGIPSSKTESNGEVIDAAWSPDGIHLACAREDNSVDVFDTRWLGQKQCMLVLKHDTDGNSAESYGVQGIAWFGSEKLVSGGADHCVRVWDVRRDEPCRVLATLGGGVGCLIGSEDPGMFPIIAGDLLGNTYYLPNPQLIYEP